MRCLFSSLPPVVCCFSFAAFAQLAGPSRPPVPMLIDVVVTDISGRPVEGAQVSWSYEAPLEGGYPLDGRGNRIKAERGTGFDGRYRIDIPAPGYWRVAVEREGYVDAEAINRVEHTESVRVDPDQQLRLPVTLLRAASFEGTVYLDDGRRVPMAIVRLQPVSAAYDIVRNLAPSWLVQRTDSNGNYRFPVVPPGQYGMWISAPEALIRASLQQNERGEWSGYAGAFWHSSVEELRRIVPVPVSAGEDVRGYNVVLRKVRVFPVKGVLYDQRTLQPLTDALVGLRVGVEAPIQLLPPKLVNPKTGAFELPPLAEGAYDLLVYRHDPGATLPITASFALGAAVQPMFSRAQTPGDERNAALWSVLGHKSEAGLAVLVPEWRPWQAKLVFRDFETMKPGRTIDRYGYQRTRVRLRPNALPEFEPVEAAYLSRDPRMSGAHAYDIDVRTPPLPDSSYLLEIEAPAGWYIDTVRSGVLSLWDRYGRLTVVPRDTGVEIVLERGGALLEGSVVNPKLQAVMYASVCALAEDPARRQQPGGAFCVRSGADGAFRTSWLSPGKWKVRAFGWRPAVRPESPAFDGLFTSGFERMEIPKEGGVPPLRLVVQP